VFDPRDQLGQGGGSDAEIVRRSGKAAALDHAHEPVHFGRGCVDIHEYGSRVIVYSCRLYHIGNVIIVVPDNEGAPLCLGKRSRTARCRGCSVLKARCVIRTAAPISPLMAGSRIINGTRRSLLLRGKQPTASARSYRRSGVFWAGRGASGRVRPSEARAWIRSGWAVTADPDAEKV